MIAVGLFNSGGFAPVAGSLNNAGLTTTSNSPFATGNAANWQGFVNRIAASGSNSEFYTRPMQTGTGATFANQDLTLRFLGNGTYDNPRGSFLSAQPSALSLVSGGLYTLDFRLTFDASSHSLTMTDNLYSGGSIGGANVYSQSAVASGADVLTTSFDGLAISIRNTGNNLNPVMDISQITVTAQSVSASVLFIMFGIVLLISRRRLESLWRATSATSKKL